MSDSLLQDGQPNAAEKRMLEGLQPVFASAFQDAHQTKWEVFRTQAETGDGLKRLLKVSGNQRSDSSSRAHEKFQRAVLHVMAGIFAACAVLLAAIFSGLGAGLVSKDAGAVFYTRIFSELIVWLALVLLLGAVAALFIQFFRFATKRNMMPGTLYSGLAAAFAIGLVFLPSYLATETAVCGALALAMKDPPRYDQTGKAPPIEGNEIAKSAPWLFAYVPVWCTSETELWFPLPKKEEPIQP